MRCRLLLVLLGLLAPAGAQDSGRVLHDLALTQERAAEALKEKIDDVKTLAADLREQGEDDKADLLLEAISIVMQKEIGVSAHRGGDAETKQTFADLREAMQAMATILRERPDATTEVQDIGLRVLTSLDKIVHKLTGQDNIESLEERENALREARRDVNELVDKQRELRNQTRKTVDRTTAEKVAEQAQKDIDNLKKEIDDLDRKARRDLEEVDAARERAQRLKDLLQRQQRLKNETAVRAGESDKLTPRLNRALAELEAIARAARKAQDEAEMEGELGELAREVGDLAKRQQKIADEIANRATLERAREMLRTGSPQDVRKALDKAAKLTKGAEAEALKRAAANLDDKNAREAADKALKNALDKMASRETLARDEKAVARDIERALMNAPERHEKNLGEAMTKALAAAKELEAGREGSKESAKAAEALRAAAKELAKDAAQAGAKDAAEKQQAEREAAAKRADDLAKKLDKLADDKGTQNAGMAGEVKQAADAARKAAEELRDAAKSAKQRNAARSADKARTAAERTEKAMRDLESGMKEGQDLTDRQGKVSEELRNLAEGAKGAAKKSLEQSAAKSDAAKKSLKQGDHKGAAENQDEVLKELKQLAEQAEGRVREAASKHKSSMDRAQAASKAAADKAGEIAKELQKGARAAKENDARRRLENAAEAVKKAEENMRRSLRRLKDMLPKSAEQDRKDAKEQLDKAKRDLKGLRESHDNVGERERQRMQDIAKRQRALEQAVKRLEENLKRKREKSGAERLQDAQSAMRQAAQQLEQGDPDEAERAQERAEKSLKEAQKELNEEERRYRSLRQYELLFKLKEELTKFRRTAQGHREALGDLAAKVRKAGRVTRLIRKGGIDPLRKQVSALGRDVGEKGEAIGKEGAIVYTYMLNGCATDLKEVEAQLELREVGLVPQELLADVVRRFDLAIKGLERDLKEKQKEKQQQQQQGQQGQQGQQNQPSLVPPDAEIRMVMVLQKELNKEREVFFDNRPDFGKRNPTPSEKARLERLYHQQGSLAELFDNLKANLMRQGNGDDPDFPDEEKEQR